MAAHPLEHQRLLVQVAHVARAPVEVDVAPDARLQHVPEHRLQRREARAAGHHERASRTVAIRELSDRSLDPERSEEHTSELQSPDHLVCRLLLEKKKYIDGSVRPLFQSVYDLALDGHIAKHK